MFAHPGGIGELLERNVKRSGKPPVHEQAFVCDHESDDRKFRFELALRWTEAPEESVLSFANGIPTTSGGTHESGLRAALHKSVRGYMKAKNMCAQRGQDCDR